MTGAFTLWETSLQEHVPARALSRVSSYDYLTSAGMIPLGNVLAGRPPRRTACTPRCSAMSVVGVLVSVGIATVPAVRRLPRGATA